MSKNFKILIVVALLFPFAVGITVSIPGMVTTANDWIGFWGSYFGGIITITGVLLTIRYYKQQEQKNEELKNKHNIKLLYWHLKFQLEKITESYSHIIKFGADFVPDDVIFSKNDYDYYFDKLAYADKALSSDEIGRLNMYYKSLLELELARALFNDYKLKHNGQIDQDKKAWFKFKLEYVFNLETGSGLFLGVTPVPCNASEILEKLREYTGIECEIKRENPFVNDRSDVLKDFNKH